MAEKRPLEGYREVAVKITAKFYVPRQEIVEKLQHATQHMSEEEKIEFLLSENGSEASRLAITRLAMQQAYAVVGPHALIEHVEVVGTANNYVSHKRRTTNGENRVDSSAEGTGEEGAAVEEDSSVRERA